jgi:hypothetical protein
MMGYGYYGEMMGGFGWVWMLLVLAGIMALVVWGTRTALWSRDRAFCPQRDHRAGGREFDGVVHQVSQSPEACDQHPPTPAANLGRHS